jgi:cytochrome c553
LKANSGFRFFAGLMLAAGIARAAEGPGHPPLRVPVEQFVAAYCAGCHGPGGQGSNPVFPKLAGQRPDYLFRELQKFRNGTRKGTIMQVRLGNLPDRDLAVLARYLGGLRRMPDSPDGAPPEETGRLLYEEGNAARGLPACSSCHGANTHGDLHAVPVPRLTAQHASYIEGQLDRFLGGTRLPGQSPRHPLAERLEDSEITSVSRYISRIE